MESKKQVKVIYTENALEVLSETIALYRKENTRFPENLNELTEKYLNKIPRDGWQNEYVYVVNTSFVQISSYGADGAIGGKNYNSDLVVKISDE